MFHCPGCQSLLSLDEVQVKQCLQCQATWEEELLAQAPGDSFNPGQTLVASEFPSSTPSSAPTPVVENPSTAEQQSPKSKSEKKKRDKPSSAKQPDIAPPIPATGNLAQGATITPDILGAPELRESKQLDPAMPKSPVDTKSAQKTETPAADEKKKNAASDLPQAESVLPEWGEQRGSTANPTVTLQTHSSEGQRDFSVDVPSRTLASKDAKDAPENPDYAVISYSAEGGMGKVFIARQNSMKRIVAIKQLKEKFAKREASRQKFLFEASVTGELDHPNIVPVHDLGVSQDGLLFYSMKLIRGQSWQEELPSKSRVENLDILLRVADAVAYAHSKNIIHRDLKPENVMLGRFGEVLVTDWGIAIHYDADTVYGICGTPAYMAPEMAENPPARIGLHSDIYLLGAILFQIVVGVPPHPHSNDTIQGLDRAAANEIVPTKIEDELLVIAKRAMSTNPRSRYANVEKFQEAVRAYQTHSESLAILSRAEEELANAQVSKSPDSFSRALFGYEDAIELWSGNNRAYSGLREAKMSYAANSLDNENFELGISLLDPEDDRDQPLLMKLEQGKKERDGRVRRLKFAKRSAAGLLGALAIVLVFFGYTLNEKEKDQNRFSKELIAKDTRLGVLEGALETESKKLADKEDVVNKLEKENIAKAKQLSAQQETLKANTKALAGKEKTIIRQNTELIEKTERALAGEQAAVQGRFLSEIALIKSRVADNEVTQPLSQLAELKSEPNFANYLDWEWDRLHYLCHPKTTRLNEGRKFSAVATSQDGSTFVTAFQKGSGSEVQLWQVRDNGKPSVMLAATVPGLDIRSMAFSSDLQRLAVGGKALAKKPGGPVVVVFEIKPQGLQQEWVLSAAEYSELSSRAVRSGLGVERVNSVDFHPQDKDRLLIAGSTTWVILLQRAATGDWNSIAELKNNDEITGAHFSHDGVAIVTVDKVPISAVKSAAGFSVWPMSKEGKFGGSPKRYPGQFNAAVFRPGDSETIACAATDGTVQLWRWREDLAQDPAPIVLARHSRPVHSIAFSRSGARLASASEDRLVQIWETGKVREKTGVMPGVASVDWMPSARLPALRGHGKPVQWCQFLGEEILLSLDVTDANYANDMTGSVRLWDLGEYYDELILAHDSNTPCTAVCVSADGKLIATGGKDGHVRLWQGPNGERVGDPVLLENPIYVGHPQASTGARFFAAPIRGLPVEEIMIATFLSQKPKINKENQDASLGVWGKQNGLDLLNIQTARAGMMTTSPQQPIAMLGRFTAKQVVDFWQLEQQQGLAWKHVNALNRRQGLASTTATFHPQTGEVFLGLRNSTGRLFSPLQSNVEGEKRFESMPEGMTSSCYTTDGNWLLTTDENSNKLEVTHATTREPMTEASIELPPGTPFLIASAMHSTENVAFVLSHAKRRSVGSPNSTITWVGIQDGKLVERGRQMGSFLHAALTPDGKSIFAIQKEQNSKFEIVEWKLSSGQMEVHAMSAKIARTRPDRLSFLNNQQLLTSSKLNHERRQAAYLWDLTQKTSVARMTSGSGVLTVRFSPDRKKLFSIGRCGVVYIWDVSNPVQPKLEKQIISQGLLDVAQAAITQDASRAVLVDKDRQVAVVDLRSGEENSPFAEVKRTLAADCLGGEIAVMSAQGNIWTLSGGADELRIPEQFAVGKKSLVRLSADGRALAVRTKQRLLLWKRDSEGQWQGPIVSDERKAQDTAICFSKSNSCLLTGSKGGKITIWQIHWQSKEKEGADRLSAGTLRELFNWRGDLKHSSILTLDFSTDGQSLVSTSASGAATLWPSLPAQAPAAAGEHAALAEPSETTFLLMRD